MSKMFRSVFAAAAFVWGTQAASAQPVQVRAAESCHATATVRQLRDNEFSRYGADAVLAGSLGVGCDLYRIGLPAGMGIVLGAFGDLVGAAPIDRRSGTTGDPLVKRLGMLGIVGGTAEWKLPAFGPLTPSLLLRYGVDVGSVVLPRGSYADARSFEKSFAKRYTQEVGAGACLDYDRRVKLCAEFIKLTYDTYPHIWTDANGAVQGRPEPITAANEVVARLVIPFNAFRM